MVVCIEMYACDSVVRGKKKRAGILPLLVDTALKQGTSWSFQVASLHLPFGFLMDFE